MTKIDYYEHIRNLGNFPALASWNMAKQAEALDIQARVSVPPATVSREVMPNGSCAIHLSFGVNVF